MKPFKTFAAPLVCLIIAACNNNTATDNTANHTVQDTLAGNNIHVEIIKPEALQLLDSSEKPTVIASGFKWAEGPVYIAAGDYLLFSDIPNNKVYKWTRNGDTSLFLSHSGFSGDGYYSKEQGSNGLLLSKQNELILMQHGNRRVAKMNASFDAPKPVFTVLADNYKGKKLNSPNDAVMAANGDIYFTDPPYGLEKRLDESSKQLPFQGVYLLKANGTLELFTDELKFPNGITLSPDEKYLYVANSDPDNKIWMQFELDSKGMKKSGKILYHAKEDDGKDDGNPDGMKMNKEGYLFAAGPQGIWIFNPSGELIARIYTGRLTANCAFGKDEKELFITADDDLMHIKLK